MPETALAKRLDASADWTATEEILREIDGVAAVLQELADGQDGTALGRALSCASAGLHRELRALKQALGLRA